LSSVSDPGTPRNFCSFRAISGRGRAYSEAPAGTGRTPMLSTSVIVGRLRLLPTTGSASQITHQRYKSLSARAWDLQSRFCERIAENRRNAIGNWRNMLASSGAVNGRALQVNGRAPSRLSAGGNTSTVSTVDPRVAHEGDAQKKALASSASRRRETSRPGSASPGGMLQPDPGASPSLPLLSFGRLPPPKQPKALKTTKSIAIRSIPG
jgi:hypothetical protein